MTEIYILRHGQTDSNLRNACIGSVDIALNEHGKEQAKRIKKKLSETNFDVIYSSPLSRAIDTISPYIKENPQIPMHMSYAFSERDFGEWEDMSYEEIEKNDPDLFQKWQQDQTYFKIPGGESISEVRDRVDKALAKILSQNEDKKILIVTHLLTGRNVIASLLDLPKESDKGFLIKNAQMAKVELKNGKGTLVELNA